MRKLDATELFRALVSGDESFVDQTETSATNDTTRARINRGISELSRTDNQSIIRPEHVQSDISSLKMSLRGSGNVPFLREAIQTFESEKPLIRLFDYELTSEGKTLINAYMPFVISRVKEVDGTFTTAIFMNMYRIGRWNVDKTEYQIQTKELRHALISGLIMYKMLVEGNASKVLQDKTSLISLSNLYTSLFYNAAASKIKRTFGGVSFDMDASRVIIATFFLKYVLHMTDERTIDEIAMRTLRSGAVTSLAAIKEFESANGIDYDSLSAFLKTFGQAFFENEIKSIEFDQSWISMYGTSTGLAVEYLPYFIHFIMAQVNNVTLGTGGGLKFYRIDDSLRKDGSTRLATALSNIL